jgi:hypothetical protein
VTDPTAALSILTAMITPAVLISACGTLIFSTATRLSRIVDRVRELSRAIEKQAAGEVVDFPEEHRTETERQLQSHAQRGRLIQASLTSFYMSLGVFVATTIAIGVVALLPQLAWVPSALGILGTVILFHGCVLLIGETRIALKSVNAEMEFTLRLRSLYLQRDKKPAER